ncbi:glutamate racemase [Candidatus Gottesmanbacteria bacterium]|nr:glutamate racemase [Candidatus Gottesmanbacteria bacterium]
MKQKLIAVVDSGSGGLSVWQAMVALLPHESMVYVGDHAHLPYSGKTTAYIRRRILSIVRFLAKLQVKLVVIACNTATVAGIDYYRQHVSNIPIIGVVPVVKTAAELSKKRSFAVISTNYTAASRYQHDLIKKYAGDCYVINLGCSNLVRAVESGHVKGASVRRHVEKVLAPLKNSDIDYLALGCTHYPFLSSIIRDVVGSGVQLLDSGAAVARRVQRVLEQTQTLAKTGKPKYLFLTTGEARNVTRVAQLLLDRKIDFTKVNI